MKSTNVLIRRDSTVEIAWARKLTVMHASARIVRDIRRQETYSVTYDNLSYLGIE